MLRCPDIYLDKLITFFIAIYIGETLAFESEDLSTLRSGWNFYFGPAINGGYFNLYSEYCIRDGDVEVVSYVQSVAVQLWMRFFLDQDDQVSTGAATFTGISFSAHA